MFAKRYYPFLCIVAFVMLSIAEEITTTSDEQEDCGKGPCGWAVYHRITRNIEFYMGNKCSCAAGLNCTRDDDDISITAYVYRCMDLSNSNS